MSSNIQTEKAMLETSYSNLFTAADQQGETWHQQITAIVNQRKSDIKDMKNKHMAAITKHGDEIIQSIAEIKQVILELKAILKSSDASLTSTYKSRNEKLRRLPPKVTFTLPTLSSPTINTEKLREMFGSLSPLSITKEVMESPEDPINQFLNEPRVDVAIDTGHSQLLSVRCLSDEEVWTIGDSRVLKLLNLRGEVLKSIPTKSGSVPRDIAVTRDGDLAYTDAVNNTVNVVKNKKIQTVVTLHGWIPLYVCSTSSGELLVTMVSDDGEQSKVVRYSGSSEKQTIQFDNQRRPLYSSGVPKYITENKNLDVCVADCRAKAVVVVNQSGKFRFRYTGPSNFKGSFDPVGITTDSHCHILTAECVHDGRIHILDQDGHFLRYIKNCHLERPLGICVDIRDNLLVAECVSAKVKKIQYLSTQC
jgi:hypothetical protein